MMSKMRVILMFVAIVIMPATTNAEDPTAVATAANVTTGGTLYSFTVLYADDGVIVVSSLNSFDVRVIGPGGFDVLGTFVGVDINFDGTPRIATYSNRPAGRQLGFRRQRHIQPGDAGVSGP
jgi:hypothetical protein